MATGIIVQARAGSTRLPAKVLRPFWKNLTLIEVVLQRLLRTSLPVTVATTALPEDDQVAQLALAQGASVSRGSVQNVLSRYVDAAQQQGYDDVVRVCADNPFLDIEHIPALVQTARSAAADYASIRFSNGLWAVRSHYGFWSEYITTKTLARLESTLAPDSPDREHVTSFVYANPAMFRLCELPPPIEFADVPQIRLTIDTETDFAVAQELLANHLKSPDNISDAVSTMQALRDARSLTSRMALTIRENPK